MKKLLPIIIVLLSIAACKKDGANKDEPNATVTIVGKWYFKKSDVKQFAADGSLVSSVAKNDFSASDYIEYKKDGTGAEYSAVGQGPFAYKLDGNKLVELQGVNTSVTYQIYLTNKKYDRHAEYTDGAFTYIVNEELER